ncbi:hypothetical protein DY240_00900 [Jiangella rhizosphaerae]|uniref:Ribbon-helix-helix protein, CopG family n=2 Tax=Jiangella rhizosphaerae TaxID=2293569 RepID=A0A418KXA8_9ACTN|nr:hypothetical protein DY240_00900 [Jiangella rhizosphaerae]
MNLRLRPDAEQALRAEAERSGRSQQEVLRAAVDTYLGIVPVDRADAPEGAGELDRLVAARMVRPPRSPYRRPARRLTLPPDMTTADLLDRDDRL